MANVALADLPGKTRKRLAETDIARMTNEELDRAIAEYQDVHDHFDRQEKRLKRENPYWYYEPTRGDTLPEDRLAFLRRHIRQEDIPQKLDGGLDVHLSSAPIRGASGGNQASKSTTGVIEGIMTASGQVPYCFDETQPNFFRWKLPDRAHRAPDDDVAVVRHVAVDFKNGYLKTLLPKYREWAPRELLKNGDFDQSFSAEEDMLYFYDPTTKRVRGAVEFMSNEQKLQSFQGPPRRKLILDEEPYEAVYKENIMRMVTMPAFEVLFCMTPTNGISWVHEKIYMRAGEAENILGADGKARSAKIEWFQIPSICNPYANLAVLEEIISELDSYDEKKMRLLGEFVSLSGLVYGRLFNKALHVIPAFNTQCTCGRSKYEEHPGNCPYAAFMQFRGLDPHTVKPSAAVFVAMDREENVYVDTSYTRQADTDELKNDLSVMDGRRRMTFTNIDPHSDSDSSVFKDANRRSRNIFKELRRGPNAIRGLRKAAAYKGSILSGVDIIKKLLRVNPVTGRPRLFIMDRPENKLLINAFRTLERDNYLDTAKMGQKDAIKETKHDLHAALRYALQTLGSWKPQSLSYASESQVLTDEEAVA